MSSFDGLTKEQIVKFTDGVRAESLATGEPAESVQIGRLQVCDELEALLDKESDQP